MFIFGGSSRGWHIRIDKGFERLNSNIQKLTQQISIKLLKTKCEIVNLTSLVLKIVDRPTHSHIFKNYLAKSALSLVKISEI